MTPDIYETHSGVAVLWGNEGMIEFADGEQRGIYRVRMAAPITTTQVLTHEQLSRITRKLILMVLDGADNHGSDRGPTDET